MGVIKFTVMSVLSFLVTMYASQPGLFKPGIQFLYSSVDSVGDRALDSSSISNNPLSNSSASDLETVPKTYLAKDYRKILELDIPKHNASHDQWQAFIGQLKVMDTTRARKPFFRYGSSAYPMLAYLAKHKPELFMSEVESGNIDRSAFALMLQMGLIQNWHEYVDDIGQIIRVEPKALLALSLSYGDDYASEQAQAAFLNKETQFDVFDTSARSLGYAMQSMDSQHRALVTKSLSTVDIEYSLTSIPVLANYMEPSDYIDFIKRNAGAEYKLKHYLVDLLLANDKSAEQKILSKYLNFLKENKFDSQGYCAVCALALSFEGGVGRAIEQNIEVDNAEEQ